MLIIKNLCFPITATTFINFNFSIFLIKAMWQLPEYTVLAEHAVILLRPSYRSPCLSLLSPFLPSSRILLKLVWMSCMERDCRVHHCWHTSQQDTCAQHPVHLVDQEKMESVALPVAGRGDSSAMDLNERKKDWRKAQRERIN